MIKGKTKSGFEFEVNPDIKKDWDFLELMENLQDGDTSLKNIKKMLVLMLTDKGFENLKNHIKKETGGITDIDKMTEELIEVTQVLDPSKNS